MNIDMILNEVEKVNNIKSINDEVIKQLCAIVGTPGDKANNYDILVHAGSFYLKKNEREISERFFRVCSQLNGDMMPAWNGLVEALTLRYTSTSISKENLIEVALDLSLIKLEQARIAKSKGNQKNLKDCLNAASTYLMNVLINNAEFLVDAIEPAIRCYRILNFVISTFSGDEFMGEIDKAKCDLIILIHNYPLIAIESQKKSDMSNSEQQLYSKNFQTMQYPEIKNIFNDLLKNHSVERYPYMALDTLVENYLSFVYRHDRNSIIKECEHLLEYNCISDLKSTGVNLLVRSTYISFFENELNKRYLDGLLLEIDEQSEKSVSKMLQAVFLFFKDLSSMNESDRVILSRVLWRAFCLQSIMRFVNSFNKPSGSFELECGKIILLQNEAYNWKKRAVDIANEKKAAKSKFSSKASKVLFGNSQNKDVLGEKLPDIWGFVSEPSFSELFILIRARCTLFLPAFAQDSSTIAETIKVTYSELQTLNVTNVKGRLNSEVSLCRMHCLIRLNKLSEDRDLLKKVLFNEEIIENLKRNGQFGSLSYLAAIGLEYSILTLVPPHIFLNDSEVHPCMKSTLDCCNAFMKISSLFADWKNGLVFDIQEKAGSYTTLLNEASNKFSSIPMGSDSVYFHPIFLSWHAQSMWMKAIMGSGNVEDAFKIVAMTAKKISIQDPQLYYLIGEYLIGMDQNPKMRQAFENGLVYDHSPGNGAIRDFTKAKQSFQKALDINPLFLSAAVALSSMIHYELDSKGRSAEEGSAREVALIYSNIVKIADDSQMDLSLIRSVVWAFTRMGQWQISNRKYDSSINYFQRALSFSPYRVASNIQAVASERSIVANDFLQLRAVLDCWIGLGECHRALDRFTSSKKVLQQACTVAEALNDNKALAFARHQTGLVSMHLCQYEDAYNSYKSCLDLLHVIVNNGESNGVNLMKRTCNEGILSALLGVIETYIKRGLIKLAKDTIENAQSIAYSALRSISNQPLHILWKLAGDIESMKSTCFPVDIQDLVDMNKEYKNETFKLARKNYAKSIFLKPWNGQAWQGLASHCTRELRFSTLHPFTKNVEAGKWTPVPHELALSIAEAAVCLDPVNSESWAILGSLYSIKKLYSNDPNDRMFEQHCIVRSLQLDHGNKVGWQNLGWSYLFNKIPTLAKDAFAEAKLDIWAGHAHLKSFETNVNQLDARSYFQALNYAIDYAGFGLNGAGYDSSIRYSHYLINDFMNNVADQHMAWNSEVSSLNWIKILDVIRFCVFSDPLSSQSWNLQGLAFEAQGNYNMALYSFEKSLTCVTYIDDESAESKKMVLLRSIARCLLSLGNPEKAINHLEKITSFDIASSLCLAQCYLSSSSISPEKLEKSMKLLQNALSMNPNSNEKRLINMEQIKIFCLRNQPFEDFSGLIDSICEDIVPDIVNRLCTEERKSLCSKIDQITSLVSWFMHIAEKGNDKKIATQAIQKLLNYLQISNCFLYSEPISAVRNSKIVARGFEFIGDTRNSKRVLFAAIRFYPNDVASWSHLSSFLQSKAEKQPSFACAENALALANTYHPSIPSLEYSLYESAIIYSKNLPSDHKSKAKGYWLGTRTALKIRHAYPWLHKN